MGRNCFAAIASLAVTDMKIETSPKVVPIGYIVPDGIEITLSPPKGHTRG